jgi:hypothetical protein
MENKFIFNYMMIFISLETENILSLTGNRKSPLDEN